MYSGRRFTVKQKSIYALADYALESMFLSYCFLNMMDIAEGQERKSM